MANRTYTQSDSPGGRTGGEVMMHTIVLLAGCLLVQSFCLNVQSVCLSAVLSVTLVYCGQMVGQIKM